MGLVGDYFYVVFGYVDIFGCYIVFVEWFDCVVECFELGGCDDGVGFGCENYVFVVVEF